MALQWLWEMVFGFDAQLFGDFVDGDAYRRSLGCDG